MRTSIYEVLILDIGECVQGLYEILKSCDTVYLLTADDPIAASKLAQFEQVMYQLGYGEVWERMVPCVKAEQLYDRILQNWSVARGGGRRTAGTNFQGP